MHGSYEDEFDVAHNKELTNCFEDTEVSDIEPYEPELFGRSQIQLFLQLLMLSGLMWIDANEWWS